MTFSKSASLCDTDAPTLISLQTQDVKSGASLRQTANSRKSVFELAFSLSSSALCIVHCVGCSAADCFSWAEMCN